MIRRGKEGLSKLVFTIERKNKVHCVVIYVDLVEFLMTAIKTN